MRSWQSIQPLSSSASRMKKTKKTQHVHSLPHGLCMCVCVCIGCTHTHTLTTMPTCLSIRFYHHRDTVDSSFVRPEKIGALRSQNHHIHCDLQRLWVCICVCVCVPVTYREKVKDVNYWWDKKNACVFVPARENLRIRFSLHLFLCFDVPGSAWAASHIEVSGCCVSEKERGQILTLSLCVISNLNRWGNELHCLRRNELVLL